MGESSKWPARFSQAHIYASSFSPSPLCDVPDDCALLYKDWFPATFLTRWWLLLWLCVCSCSPGVSFPTSGARRLCVLLPRTPFYTEGLCPCVAEIQGPASGGVSRRSFPCLGCRPLTMVGAWAGAHPQADVLRVPAGAFATSPAFAEEPGAPFPSVPLTLLHLVRPQSLSPFAPECHQAIMCPHVLFPRPWFSPRPRTTKLH